MSFILDALKKSERERRQGEIPRLSNEPSAAPKSRPWWPYLIVIALFLNGGIFAWILLGRDQSAENSKAGANPPVEQVSSPAVTIGEDALEQEQVPARTHEIAVDGYTETEFPTPARKVPQPSAKAAAPSAEAEISPPSSAPVAADRDVSDNEERSPRVVAAADAAGTGQGSRPEIDDFAEVPRYGDLPAGLRETLPALDLQLHFYSRRPKKRLVRLNGENLREGDRSGTGLTIEEIVADGVVLDFRGTRFLYPAGR